MCRVLHNFVFELLSVIPILLFYSGIQILYVQPVYTTTLSTTIGETIATSTAVPSSEGMEPGYIVLIVIVTLLVVGGVITLGFFLKHRAKYANSFSIFCRFCISEIENFWISFWV